MNNNNQIAHIALSEEDEALLALVGICLIFSIFMPLVLILSPEVLKEVPLFLSIFVVSLFGPGFTISLREMRFLLTWLNSYQCCIKDANDAHDGSYKMQIDSSHCKNKN